MAETKRSSVYQLAMCAVMAAVLCVLGPLAVPIGPVPITCGTLGIYLTAYLLGGKWAAVSTLVYLLVGLVGAPVFSGYMGGISRLIGPTGGYLIGYLPMALIAGWVISLTAQRLDLSSKTGLTLVYALQFLGMVAATAVLYTFGTAWYCIEAEVGLEKALTACVLPFIPFDLLKIVITMVIGVPIRWRLEQTGLL